MRRRRAQVPSLHFANSLGNVNPKTQNGDVFFDVALKTNGVLWLIPLQWKLFLVELLNPLEPTGYYMYHQP
jgi:hypothetical protein